MGSRGMVHALQRLRADRGSRRLLNQLVLLAPDFDSETFIGLLPRLTPLAQRITLYASGNDTPLKVSRQLNGYPRLGEAGDYLTVVAGMETIDVSPVGRYQFLGHEYFYYHPLVAADLVELLTTNRPAGVRRGLRRSTKNGLDYWEIVESEPH
jgi:esterase/lipase superfamily enzyme